MRSFVALMLIFLRHLYQVKYGTEAVKYGTELYSLQIENEPVVVFKGERQTYYTLIAIGKDIIVFFTLVCSELIISFAIIKPE